MKWVLGLLLGTVAYGDNNDEVFLGMSMGRQQSVSESTAQKIDAEVRRLVETGLEEARRILAEQGKSKAEIEKLGGPDKLDVDGSVGRAFVAVGGA